MRATTAMGVPMQFCANTRLGAFHGCESPMNISTSHALVANLVVAVPAFWRQPSWVMIGVGTEIDVDLLVAAHDGAAPLQSPSTRRNPALNERPVKLPMGSATKAWAWRTPPRSVRSIGILSLMLAKPLELVMAASSTIGSLR